MFVLWQMQPMSPFLGLINPKNVIIKICNMLRLYSQSIWDSYIIYCLRMAQLTDGSHLLAIHDRLIRKYCTHQTTLNTFIEISCRDRSLQLLWSLHEISIKVTKNSSGITIFYCRNKWYYTEVIVTKMVMAYLNPRTKIEYIGVYRSVDKNTEHAKRHYISYLRFADRIHLFQALTSVCT